MKSYAVPLLKTRRAELSNSTCRVKQFDVSSWQRWHAELTKMARRVLRHAIESLSASARQVLQKTRHQARLRAGSAGCGR